MEISKRIEKANKLMASLDKELECLTIKQDLTDEDKENLVEIGTKVGNLRQRLNVQLPAVW